MPKQKRKNTDRNVRVVATGTPVRLQPPKSGRRPKPRATDVAVVVAQEINPAAGFVGFLREHAVVSLAVGFAIATQAQTVVKQLIASFLDPLYGLLFNGAVLSQRTAKVHLHGRTEQFAWGAFVYTIIDFLFVLAAIYAIIKLFKLDKLDQPKSKK